ncbi:gliding motility lipoprotein GldH [Bacteroides sp. 519]|uniref:gliding motility lipoprotein GldH n=1 Tax=Bacteroides sp. 519 TaxID=2302937 RepID=UPI0013D529DB|nr:gliding motility lipoprotein GldH [Bacteroides sp. 519]NDV59920.1 gliding motility lipoprotein GldH [Bacteroides sp. 519]
MSLVKKICLLFLCVFMVACENHIMYHSYHHFTRDGWKKSDTLLFHLAVNDSLVNDSTPGLYVFDILVRNRTEYNYQNLLIAVKHNFPDSMVWKTDTLQFQIADENGRWLGNGISGLYESSLTLDASPLVNPHRFTFKVVSLMQDSVLVGLNDLGVIAHKHKE